MNPDPGFVCIFWKLFVRSKSLVGNGSQGKPELITGGNGFGGKWI